MTEVDAADPLPALDAATVGAAIEPDREDRSDAAFTTAHALLPLLTAMQRALLMATRRGPLQCAGLSWKTPDGRLHFRRITLESLVDHGLLTVVGKRAETTASGRAMLDILAHRGAPDR